jgi:hypothetical protein
MTRAFESGPYRLVVALVMMAGPVTLQATEVDCGGQLSAQERLVCRDETLSALDYRLDVLYSLASEIAQHADAVRSEQTEWLHGVRDNCADASCLATAYRQRVDALWHAVQKSADPLPREINARVQHSPSLSPYCSIVAEGSDAGDWFSIEMSIHDQWVSGTIDGIFDCGRRVWGELEIRGRIDGNVAVVQFEPAWRDREQGPPAEAVILVAAHRMYWRVLTEVHVETYVPTAEEISIQGDAP